MKVRNMITPNNNTAPNQFIITTSPPGRGSQDGIESSLILLHTPTIYH